MYEYLACGLKVVSVEWEQIKDMAEYVHFANNKDEFLCCIRSNKAKQKFNLYNTMWIGKLDALLKN